METKTAVSEKIIKGLRKATVELEEFQVQAALGKAEARDAFESAKSKFNKSIHETKLRLDKVKDMTKEKLTQLRTFLEGLQVQLALGKAETREMFEEQRKNINKALHKLENFIRKNKVADEYFSKLHMEVEKFKIKLDILKFRFEMERAEVADKFAEKKGNISRKFAEIKERLHKNEAKRKHKWGHFREEISEAFLHMKKAFVS